VLTTFPPSLNRRHKAALFLALIPVGVGLLLGAGAKQSLGMALLGMAFAWAFGSDSRPVHWLFVVAGTVLAFAPLALQWHERCEAAPTGLSGPTADSLGQRFEPPNCPGT
jgi:hypothetical protein